MKIQNKKEIKLTVEDLENLVAGTLMQEMGINIPNEVNCFKIKFDWKVVNKPYPCGIHDVCDRHEFDGVKVVFEHEY
jgi:hypothetical protein